MKYLCLGDSDLRVSEVCLGTMTWGEQNSAQEAHAQLDFAVEHGVDFFDTAELYPVPARAETQGRSEEILGAWLKGRDRSRYRVASKVIGKSRLAWIRNGGGLDRAHIRAAVEGSLRRMQTDYIDLYQLHWPDRYTPRFGGLHFEPQRFQEGAPILESLEALSELIREGKIRHFGLSNETPYGLGQFIALAEKHDLPKPVSLQNAYNLLNRVFEIDLLETCFHERVTLLAYSPLAFGFLSGKYRNGAKPEKGAGEPVPQVRPTVSGKDQRGRGDRRLCRARGRKGDYGAGAPVYQGQAFPEMHDPGRHPRGSIKSESRSLARRAYRGRRAGH